MQFVSTEYAAGSPGSTSIDASLLKSGPSLPSPFWKEGEGEEGVCLVDILDTAGQEEYMRDNYYRLGEGFLIVYSITMRDTFTDVNRFHDHILSVKGVEDVPLIVVGSKCDLDSDREVPTAEGKALAEKFDVPFFETSAKTRVHVDEVFFELVRLVKKYKSSSSPEEEDDAEAGKGCCTLM